MPRDRAIVLEQIRREWGSEAAYETFVRTQLPVLLQAPSGATASRWPGWRGVPSRWPLADEWETGTMCGAVGELAREQ